MKTLAAIVIVVTAIAAEAQAGARRSFAVRVDSVSRFALGDLGTARNSSDPYQVIGCAVAANAGGEPQTVNCEAVDSTNVREWCHTYDPELAAVARAIGSDSYVYFTWDSAHTCTRIYVSNLSQWQPKQ